MKQATPDRSPPDTATAPHARPDARPAAQPDDMPPRMRSALASLQQSRQARRSALMPAPLAARDTAHGSRGVRLLWRRLQRGQVGRVATDALRDWWRAHPWQPLGETLASEARLQVLPTVRRHPWATVGIAAMLGAGITALRPWRWAWLQPHMRRTPGLASNWLVHQLGSLPVQAALASWLLSAARTNAGSSNAVPQPSGVPVPATTANGTPHDQR